MQQPPFTLRTLEEIEGIIGGVARAIERLDEGTYSQCENCGAPIANAALMRDPLLVRCTEHVIERPSLFADA